MKYNPNYIYYIDDSTLKELLIDIEVDPRNILVALYMYAHTGNLQSACFGLKSHELNVINHILECSPGSGNARIIVNDKLD